jgi:hypothetical protein
MSDLAKAYRYMMAAAMLGTFAVTVSGCTVLMVVLNRGLKQENRELKARVETLEKERRP